MHLSIDDPNRNYYLNLCKDIVKTEDGFCLRNSYKEADDGNVESVFFTWDERTEIFLNKRCSSCIHRFGANCLVRTGLERLPKNHYIPHWWVSHCEARATLEVLTLIRSENDMVDFIEKAANFFDCPESYENYFGFERLCDENTGDILESAVEYYNRGGKFTNIPDKYPCVIYFGVIDQKADRATDDHLEWLYLDSAMFNNEASS